MTRKLRIGLVSLALLNAPVHADWVRMDNGDRYSGRVTALEQGKLRLEGSFGRLELPWNRIEALETEQPLRITLEGGERVVGRLSVDDGQVRIDDEQARRLTFAPDRILAAGPVSVPTLQLSGWINAGANVTRGNTHTAAYHADAELVARTEQNRTRVGAEFNYGSENGERTINNAAAYLNYDHFVSRRWYFNSNLGLARDEFRDLDLRTTVGVGFGYLFLDAPPDRLAIELGLSYLHENFDKGEDNGEPAARYALDFVKQLAAGPRLFHRHEVLAGLETSDNVLLRSQTGIRFPLWERLTSTVQVNFDYDWDPAEGSESEDVVYLFSLGYTF